jgi:DNA-binding response OmpR family regulator
MKIDKIRDISILLAEDEEELRESLREYLELFFHRVYVASNGLEAYEIYKYKKPSIIITDVNMPALSGLEFVSKIRENDLETKIIILSAYSDQEKLLQAIKLHLEIYLIKPIKTDALKKILFETVDSIKKTTNRAYVDETIYWDYKTSSLWLDSKEVKLRSKENLLLKLLFSKPNQTFSAQAIFKYIQSDKEKKPFSNYAVTSLIKRIRSKLPLELIHNIYGSGYKITTL